MYQLIQYQRVHWKTDPDVQGSAIFNMVYGAFNIVIREVQIFK
jgi:hypothetical protein